LTFKVRQCSLGQRSVRSGRVLSSLARCGFSWRGKVLRGRLLHGEVLHGQVRHGVSWRAMVSSGTVLSCPVRSGKAEFFELWYGIAGWSPARLSQAVLGKLRRLCCADRWGKLLHGIVLFGKVLLWSGEALLGGVGFIGALYSKVRSYCGMVWRSLVNYGKALFWKGGAGQSDVLYAEAPLRQSIVRYGTVESGLARLRAVGQASLFLKWGMEWWGGVKYCTVM
jgi:hypothetical protein